MILAIKADVEGRESEREMYEDVRRSIDDYFISLRPPQDFNPRSVNNAVNAMDKGFHKLCASLEDAGINDPKNLSLYDFNVRLEFYKEKDKKK